jgi:hypothetical protein
MGVGGTDRASVNVSWAGRGFGDAVEMTSGVEVEGAFGVEKKRDVMAEKDLLRKLGAFATGRSGVAETSVNVLLAANCCGEFSIATSLSENVSLSLIDDEGTRTGSLAAFSIL